MDGSSREQKDLQGYWVLSHSQGGRSRSSVCMFVHTVRMCIYTSIFLFLCSSLPAFSEEVTEALQTLLTEARDPSLRGKRVAAPLRHDELLGDGHQLC